jgi:hypothetical protein
MGLNGVRRGMYTERQLDLCARIREHCRAQRWYWPQAVNPWLEQNQELNTHEWDPTTGLSCVVPQRW